MEPNTNIALIKECFKRHTDNLELVADFDAKLFTPQDCDSWLNCYKSRSAAIRQAYDDSSKNVAVLSVFLKDVDNWDSVIAETFYNEVMAIDMTKHDDPFLACRYLTTLLKYYGPTNDIPKILRLNHRLGFEYCNCARMGYQPAEKAAYDCYLTMLSYREHYSKLSNPEDRRMFFIAYNNIITAIPTMDGHLVSVDKAAEYLTEEIAFFNSEEVQKLDKDNESITSVFYSTRRQFLSIDFKMLNASEDTKKFYCDLENEIYAEQSALIIADPTYFLRMGVNAIIANQQASIFKGDKTYIDAIKYLLDYYDERHQNSNKKFGSSEFKIDNDFYFEIHLPDAVIAWFEMAHAAGEEVDSEFEKATINSLIAQKTAFLADLNKSSYSPFVNYVMSSWCFKTLHFHDSLAKKESVIFDNIINRQVVTFFHSHMVEKLAGLFTDSLLEHRPELLLPITSAVGEGDMEALAQSARTYIRKAALLHDIGKNKITNIINMQTRRLTDEEFEVIRQHPFIGVESVDSDFAAYHDVILGHHRTYDCKGGYPMSFDPSDSPLKVAIDLIAVCDALDAATDYLGRNYSCKKSLNDVIVELREGSGTRYNPDIVALIDSDPALYKQLDKLLSTGRGALYYKLFSEHFMTKNVQ